MNWIFFYFCLINWGDDTGDIFKQYSNKIYMFLSVKKLF